MREVILSNGKSVNVRPLTRGQIRAMEPLGVTAAGFVGNLTAENYGAVLDAVLATQAVPPEELDALSIPDCRELFSAITAETWGKKEEEKNSPTPGPIAQAGSN